MRRAQREARADARSGRTILGSTFVALGVSVLLACYVAIAVRLGTPAIWNLPAHEDGIRTFGATVLYCEHAVRELPLDRLLGLAIGGSLAFALPLRSPRGASACGALLVVFLVLVLAGALGDVGAAGVLDNLLQKHTRPGAPLEWGAHWRYHLLSSLALLASSFGLGGLLRRFIGAGAAAEAERGFGCVVAAFAAVALGSLLFAHSPAGLAKPFLDPVHVGHQARELFTHALATVPIAWGAGLLLARDPSAPAAEADRATRTRAWAAALGLAVALGLHLAAGAPLLESASRGQSDDLVTLIAPHFFEHAQSYGVVTLTALFVHRQAARRNG